MVTGGGSSSPEAICPRSGGMATAFTKEVLACLNSVMAMPSAGLSRVVVFGTRCDNRERSPGSGGGGDRLVARASAKMVLPIAGQKTVSLRGV